MYRRVGFLERWLYETEVDGLIRRILKGRRVRRILGGKRMDERQVEM